MRNKFPYESCTSFAQEAARALRNFKKSFTSIDNGYASGGLVPKNIDIDNHYWNKLSEIIKEHLLSIAIDCKKYSEIRKYSNGELMNKYTVNAKGTACFPGPSGTYIKFECLTREIENEMEEHRTIRGDVYTTGNKYVNIKLQPLSTPEIIQGEIGSNLSDFSTIELLEELEKRTKIENE